MLLESSYIFLYRAVVIGAYLEFEFLQGLGLEVERPATTRWPGKAPCDVLVDRMRL